MLSEASAKLVTTVKYQSMPVYHHVPSVVAYVALYPRSRCPARYHSREGLHASLKKREAFSFSGAAAYQAIPWMYR